MPIFFSLQGNNIFPPNFPGEDPLITSIFFNFIMSNRLGEDKYSCPN